MMRKSSYDSTEVADDTSTLSLKDRIKLFSKKGDECDLLQTIKRTSGHGSVKKASGDVGGSAIQKTSGHGSIKKTSGHGIIPKTSGHVGSIIKKISGHGGSMIKKASGHGTPKNPVKKIFKKAINNAFTTHQKIDKETFAEETEDLEIVQHKLEKVDDLLATMLSEMGQGAFMADDLEILLEERDGYMKKLEKAGITPEKKGISNPIINNNTSTDAPPPTPVYESSLKVRAPSKRSLGPKKRSHKVSARRLRDLEVKYVPKTFEKTPEDIEIVQTSLAKNFIFKKVTDRALEQMLQAFEPLEQYKKGDMIIQQYDNGDYFYILGKGSVIYEVNGVNVGGTDQPGASFGELALLYQSPRKATVRADSDEMRIYRVDQMTFRYILQSRSKFKAMGMQAVAKVKAVNRLLGLVDLTADIDALGAELEGEKKFVMIDDRKSNNSNEDDDGDQDFLDFSERRMSVRSSMSVSTVSVESFHRESVLGEGQFGEVWLVQPTIQEIDEEKFALKIQSKDSLNRASMEYSVEEAIKRECDVLSSLCHPYIVDFVHNFEDEENIYMVMGAIHGVELWEYIHREQEDGEWISGIPEDHAKFFAFVIGDTLNYMHRQKICHRDIKPENVMINEDGYPVLVDFGFAKVLPDGKTYTLCGTPKYTAPEVITNEGHGCAVDHWALGVVIYEMISGENPFWYDDISDLQLLDDICNQTPYPIQDDADCTEEARDIIMKMLEKDPLKRLVGRDVTSHAWFDGLDIHKARKSELVAPWLPPPK